MLQLSVEKGVKLWVEKQSLKDANRAVADMTANRARYRYVLVNEHHANL